MNRTINSFPAAVAAAVVSVAAISHAAVTQYDIKPLASTGTPDVYARDINNLGQIVGYSVDTSGNSRAVIWQNPTAAATDLPLLSQTNPYSEAYRINDAGQIVGKARTDSNQSHAAYWDGQGGVTDIGTLGGVHSFANDINEAGVVVGSAAATNNGTRAFRWTPAGGIVDDGNLNSASAGAHAGWNGINNTGLMVGTAYQIFSPYKASMGRPGDRSPTVISPAGQFSTGMAMAVNDAGVIVGYQNGGSGSPHASIFDGVGGYQDLGSLGLSDSQALDINESGLIVGTAFGDDGTGAFINMAFVYADGQMYDLTTLLRDGTGWELLFEAASINDLGQIVGSGIYQGAIRGFVATPVPEPTLLGVAWGAATLLARRRRD
jgi:probable HAF family extracellular repeat protein